MAYKVLVTGGKGVLGEGLRSVASEYQECSFVFPDKEELDLLSASDATSFIEKFKPDFIMHLAAVSGGVGLSRTRPADLLRDNVLMSFNVLEAARKNGVKKTLMTLSSGMYPEEAPLPLSEESIHDGPPHISNYSYAFAKRLIEPSIVAYRAQYGLNVIGVVPNGIFGRHADFALESSAMWASLVRRMYENKLSNEDIIVWGDGTPLREHTYSEDMAKAFMWCMLNYEDPGILNVGSSEELSVKEIAFLIADMMGINRDRIVFDTTKPAGVHRKSIDNSQFLKLSGFSFRAFEEGLFDVVKWYSSNF